MRHDQWKSFSKVAFKGGVLSFILIIDYTIFVYENQFFFK